MGRARIVLAAAIPLQFLLQPASAQDEDLAIEQQGVVRHVLLHLPSASPAGKWLLIIYLHGLRPENWKNHTQPEIDALADRDGALAAYPEALGHRWNYTPQIREPAKIGDVVADDVGFIRKLIMQLIASNNVDPSRVYVLGDSRGGLMTYTVMCQPADQIAAAAPLISGMTGAQIAECKPARAVPLMVVAGTNDPMQSYDGFRTNTSRLLSVPETVEFWGVRHRCTGQETKELTHRLSDDTTRIMLSESTGCATEGAVRLYRVIGGGHQVPSFAPGDPDWIKQAGPINHDIETAEEFWAFARKFRN
jgi:polyhydroxybutyrate depolymerase